MSSSDKPAIQMQQAQQAAAAASAAHTAAIHTALLQSVDLVHVAAANAAKTGWRSSEFWVSAFGGVAAIALPFLGLGPIGIPAAVVVGAVVAAYNVSRGNVKATALAAVGALAKAAPQLLPGNSAAAALAPLVTAVVSDAAAAT